jgi:hypothetical protein
MQESSSFRATGLKPNMIRSRIRALCAQIATELDSDKTDALIRELTKVILSSYPVEPTLIKQDERLGDHHPPKSAAPR